MTGNIQEKELKEVEELIRLYSLMDLCDYNNMKNYPVKWIFTGLVVLAGIVAIIYILVKEDLSILHILYINDKKILLKNKSVTEDIYLSYLKEDYNIIKNNFEKITHYIIKDINRKKDFLKRYFSKISTDKKIIFFYNVFDLDNLYILNKSENKDKLNFGTYFSYYSMPVIHLFRNHKELRHYDLYLDYKFEYEKNLNEENSLTIVSKASFKMEPYKMNNYYICYSISFFQQHSEKLLFDFENNLLLSRDHEDLWMHEFIESYILRAVLNFENVNNKDIFLRWVQDGLAEFYAEKYMMENYPDIADIVTTYSFDTSEYSETDILNWGISSIFEKDFEVLKDKTVLYLKSKSFFKEIEQNHGYETIERLLIFMNNSERLTSEKVLTFLENDIGKENLEKLIGKNFLQRVQKARYDFFELVLEKYKNNKEILKVISNQEYISSPEKIKIKVRNILKSEK